MTVPSSAALRMRRSRDRRRQGDVIVSLDVGPKVTADLVELGWLPAHDCDKDPLPGMRTVLASALRRRECARSLHQLYAAAAGAAASGGTIPLSLGDHQHDLLHAPQLLGRIKRGIEGRRILCVF